MSEDTTKYACTSGGGIRSSAATVKGSLAFYALRDYIGEDAMNSALRAFLAKWALKGPPYPTARDLYAELIDRTPEDNVLAVVRR